MMGYTRKAWISLLPEDEKAMMRDVYRFLVMYHDPPKMSDPQSFSWWSRMNAEQVKLVATYDGHPLIVRMLWGATQYILSKVED